MRFISIRTVVAIVLLFALLFSTFPMSALANDTDNPEETAVTEDTATVESSKRAKYTTDPQKFEVIPTEKVTVEAETSPVESQEQTEELMGVSYKAIKNTESILSGFGVFDCTHFSGPI